MEITDPLRDRVEQFLRDHPEITPTAFGHDAIKDPKFVFDLRQGRECRRATRERVLRFIADRSDKDDSEQAA